LFHGGNRNVRLEESKPATIERERIAAQIAERTVMDARTHGKKFAKEVLEEFMHTFATMAAVYQPMPPGQTNCGSRREPDPDRFDKYAKAHNRVCDEAPTF
jgi:hypothetical protein